MLNGVFLEKGNIFMIFFSKKLDYFRFHKKAMKISLLFYQN